MISFKLSSLIVNSAGQILIISYLSSSADWSVLGQISHTAPFPAR